MSQPIVPLSPDKEKDGGYCASAQTTWRAVSPGFADHLASQAEGREAEEGRMAVVEVQDESAPAVREFMSSRALIRYLDKKSSAAGPTALRRRIFVLEGLPRNFIEALGSRLRIPPAFFASHWMTGRQEGALLNRMPRYCELRNEYTLKIPRMQLAQIRSLSDDKLEPIYRMDTPTRRPLSRITLFGEFDGPLSNLERVSFWVGSQGQSWDALVLVDPTIGDRVIWRDSPILRIVDRSPSITLGDSLKVSPAAQHEGSWYPPISLSSSTTTHPATTETTHLPAISSIFDDILALYPLTTPLSTANPNTCLSIPRKLALSAYTASLRTIESLILEEQFRMSTGPGTPTSGPSSTTTWLETSWARRWQPRTFGRLVRARLALETTATDLRLNMEALGIGTSQGPIVADWEVDAWQSVRSALEGSKQRLDILWEAYSAAVSVRESIASNRQGQQVGYLTSLATLFIPVSLVAAIFSMGGDFAVGGSQFWVYWAISIPVVVGGCLMVFTRRGRRIVGWHLSDEEG